MDCARLIDAVAGSLERENVPFALVGAFALHAYGLSRATSDLDFVKESEVRERLIAFLEMAAPSSYRADETRPP